MRLDVFGRHVEVVRRTGQWRAFYLGSEGKKRAAVDIVIPAGIAESELLAYVADLCHEWATLKHPEVSVLSEK